MAGSLRGQCIRSAPRGFTLVELLTTVTVMVVLLAVAVPSFGPIYFSYRLTSFTNEFVATVQLARSEAIKRNGNITVCRSADGNTCAGTGGWQQGWVVLSGTDVVYRHAALTDGFRFTGNAYVLNFDALGNGNAAANLSLCQATPKVGNQERSIRVNASGRTSISTTKNGVCS